MFWGSLKSRLEVDCWLCHPTRNHRAHQWTLQSHWAHWAYQRVLESHMNYFQQGAASHFNDACIHRLIVVSVTEGARQVASAQQAASSNILKLIDALISEGARFDSNLYRLRFRQFPVDCLYHFRQMGPQLIVIYSKIPLHFFSDKYGIFCEGEWR